MGVPIKKWNSRDLAMNIVNQLALLWEVDADLRQATNDKADDFVEKLIVKWTFDAATLDQKAADAYQVGFSDGEDAAYEHIHAMGQAAREAYKKRTK